MADSSSRIRLVRCPKCNHLLPELPAYSVYCCGGCGAFLRAERTPRTADDSSEKSSEKNAGESSSRSQAVEPRRPGRTQDRPYQEEVPMREGVLSDTDSVGNDSSSFAMKGDTANKSPARSVRNGSSEIDSVGDISSEFEMKGRAFGGFDRFHSPNMSPARPGRTGASRLSSPMRLRDDGASRSKSPVRPVRKGFMKSPAREEDAPPPSRGYRSPNYRSPVRSERGGVTGLSPAATEDAPGGSYTPNKSPARSVRGGIRRSPARETTSPANSPSRRGFNESPSKSPARSVRGGVNKSPAREEGVSVGPMSARRGFAFGTSPARDNALDDHKEIPATEKVGAWFDQQIIGKEAEEGGQSDRLITQKASFRFWVNSDENEDHQQAARSNVTSRNSPRRRRRWDVEGYSRLGAKQVYNGLDQNQVKLKYQYESEYGNLYERKAFELQHDEGWVDRPDHGIAARGSRDGRVEDGHVEEESGSLRERYPDEGPSNYQPNVFYDEPGDSYGSFGSHTKERVKAELYQKCIELQEQIRRFDDSDKPVASLGKSIASPQVSRGRFNELYSKNEYLRPRMRTTELVAPHEEMRPSYSNGHSHAPHVGDRSMEGFSSNARHAPATVPYNDETLYGDDPTSHRMPRASNLQPRYYPQQSATHAYVSRRSMESIYDPSIHYPGMGDLHHPNCPCPYCHANNFRARAHPQATSGGFRHRRSPTQPVLDFSDPYGLQGYNPRFANSDPHMRSPSSAVSDGSGSSHHPRRTNQRRQFCHPIAGGAPFVVCTHCSQLLKLPKNVKVIKKSKLKCGSCYTVLVFDFEKKKPHGLTPQSNLLASSFVERMIRSSEAFLDESALGKTPEGPKVGGLSSETYSFDKTAYTFLSTDSEPSMILEERRMSSIEAERKQGILSPPSSHGSREETDFDAALGKSSSQSEAALDQASVPLMSDLPHNSPPCSPLQERVDSSVSDEAKHIMDIADRAKEPIADDEEGTLPLNSSDNVPQENDADVDIDEMSITDQFQDSTNVSRKEDGVRNKKHAGWIFTSRANVFVNGQPMSRSDVESAENLAGPISPGDYWYDSRAGFWGVMGNHCLGIIPPNIPEFGFPMPVNCAGGNTSIYVNGRELNEQDLEVLGERQFPCKKNKFYTMDASGRVEDEETGKLECDLGILAPSVQRNKRGFGMESQEDL